MSGFFLFLTFFLVIVAVLLRADFALTLLYLLLGVYFLGRWWGKKALSSVIVQRKFIPKAFYGEKIPVSIELKNKGRLPAVWLQVNEGLPTELHPSGQMREVVSMGGRDHLQLEYQLEGSKRGVYSLGPLMLHSGDIFGLSPNASIKCLTETLTVYPKIIPLSKVPLPSRFPMGTIKSTQPLFEDPNRILGKREYIYGDSLRRIDWKSSAATGKLQVKLYEPSIALDVIIFLNMNSEEYELRTRIIFTELAVVVAASLANWIISQRQSVGLVTNGADPLSNSVTPPTLLARNGRSHLIRILETLARIEAAETYPLIQSIRREVFHLPWGTSLILISQVLDDEVFDSLFQARQAGMKVILIPCGPILNPELTRKKANYFGFPVYHILSEKDLDMWRA